MTVTTEYGTWNNHGDSSCVRVEDTVAEFLNEFVDDYDFDGLVSAYREAINDALPEGVSLHGDDFYGPYPGDVAGEEIREAIQSVDLGALAEKYDTTQDTTEYEIHTQIRNNSGSWETIVIERGTRHDFDHADVSAHDIGGQPEQELRLVLVDPAQDGDAAVIDTREIQTR